MIIVEGTGSIQSKAALFLDRDGIINIDHGYVASIDRFEWVPGIFDLCRTAVCAGYAIVVVTNQAGIARGYYDQQQFQSLSEWMIARFAERDIPIARVVGCPHHPQGAVGSLSINCECRKPAPGMITRTVADFDLDPAQCILIGDQMTDVDAGRAAQIGTNLLICQVRDTPQIGQTCLQHISQASKFIQQTLHK